MTLTGRRSLAIIPGKSLKVLPIQRFKVYIGRLIGLRLPENQFTTPLFKWMRGAQQQIPCAKLTALSLPLERKPRQATASESFGMRRLFRTLQILLVLPTAEIPRTILVPPLLPLQG